jgi:hypothetical protein
MLVSGFRVFVGTRRSYRFSSAALNLELAPGKLKRNIVCQPGDQRRNPAGPQPVPDKLSNPAYEVGAINAGAAGGNYIDTPFRQISTTRSNSDR